METHLKENETIEDLQYKNLKIIQNKEGFRFGIDAVILAGFAKNGINKSKVLDIGTGTGIISILLAEKTDLQEIIAIDVQKEVCEMARRSVKLNKLENKIKIVNQNIKEIEEILEKNSIDVVITNPPYQKKETGITSENEKEKISRHEILCTLEDICKATKHVLKPNGKMYLIHRPERLADIIYSLKNNGLEPKEMKFVEPRSGEKPNLVLIKAVKGGKSFLKVHKPLIVYEKNGEYTNEILQIYDKI